jgi:tetratricopeptide (TPR) repeat protein
MDKLLREDHRENELETMWHESYQLYQREQYMHCMQMISQHLLNSRNRTNALETIDLKLLNNYNLCLYCFQMQQQQVKGNEIIYTNESLPKFDQLVNIAERHLNNMFYLNENQKSMNLQLDIILLYLTIHMNNVLCMIDNNREENPSILENALSKTLDIMHSFILPHISDISVSNGLTLQDLINESFKQTFPQIDIKMNEILSNTGSVPTIKLIHQIHDHIINIKRLQSFDLLIFKDFSSLELFYQCEVLICEIVLLICTIYLRQKRYINCNNLLLDGKTNNVHEILKTVSEIQSSSLRRLMNIEQNSTTLTEWTWNNSSSLVSRSYLMLSLVARCLEINQLAIAYCNNAIETFSTGEFLPAIFLCAFLHYENNSLSEAREMFEKCAHSKQKYLFESMNMLGIIYSQQHEFVKALQWFQKASEVLSINDERQRSILFYNISIQYGLMKNANARQKMLEIVWQVCMRF